MEVHVNLDNLTFGDLETLEKADTKELSASELNELLTRALDRDVRDMPLSLMRNILTALNEAIDSMANPEVGGKN